MIGKYTRRIKIFLKLFKLRRFMQKASEQGGKEANIHRDRSIKGKVERVKRQSLKEKERVKRQSLKEKERVKRQTKKRRG